MQPCFNLERTSASSFRGSISGPGLRLLRFHAPRRPNDRRAQRAAYADRPAAWLASLARRRQQQHAASAFRREDQARRGGVRVKLARAILEVAFRGCDRAPAMHDAAFRANRARVLVRAGRTRLNFSSSVVQVSPLATVEKIAQPSAESRSVAANPPCTVPSGL